MKHEYDYKGHDLEQALLHSSIRSRILSHLLYTLGYTKTKQVTPSLHFCCFPVTHSITHKMVSCMEEGCWDEEVNCVYTLRVPICTSSACGFWHCHPYNSFTYWKMYIDLLKHMYKHFDRLGQ